MRLLFLGLLFTVINFFIKGKRGIYLMFLGILIVMGFQGKAGHDYIGYEYYFSLINSSVDSQYYTDYIESGWILLNKLFSFANFPIFVFFISFIQYLILVCFVGKYVSRNVWVNFAFFLFFFTQSFLGFQLSGLRQGFAIELLVFSFICVDKRRYVWALLSALFMYNIHHSSLVAVPFLVLFYLYTKGHFHKIEKYFHSKIIIIFPIIFVILYIVKNTFINYITPLAAQYSLAEFEGYTQQLTYIEVSPLIILFDFICILAICLYLKECKGSMRFFCFMSIISLFGESILFGLSDLPRITYYFSIFNLVVLPNVGMFLQKKYNKYISIIFVLICCGYALKTFIPYVTSPDIPRIMNFQFIFEL